MQLIGMHDSPYVRRVVVTARLLGIELEYLQLSIFRSYDEFRQINPMVKVPTLVCDDGQILVESSLIIDYLESREGRGKLMPSDESSYIRALSIIGAAMVANEKAVHLIYELMHRPPEAQHPPWQARLREQLSAALDVLVHAIGDGSAWLFDDQPSQADITAAITWWFVHREFPDDYPAERYPGLAALHARAEALPEFEMVSPD